MGRDYPRGITGVGRHALGDAVLQRGNGSVQGLRREGGGEVDAASDAALEALDLGQAAVASDIGGLGRPRRLGANTRYDQKQLAFSSRLVIVRHQAVIEYLLEPFALITVELVLMVNEMDVFGMQGI